MSESNPDKLVGTVIQNRRLELGISQGELAEQLRSLGTNWSQGTLSRVELGERPVRLVEAAVVAEALGIDMRRLLQVEGSPEERLLAIHRTVEENIESLVGRAKGIYARVDDVKELLDMAPHLVSALGDNENPGPKDSAGYVKWVAEQVEGLDLGTPYPAESTDLAIALMAIPRAAISRSVSIYTGEGDDEWEIVR